MSRDKVWCVTGPVTPCHVLGWPSHITCQDGTNKQMWQVWARSEQTLGALASNCQEQKTPDPDKLETTGSMAIRWSLILGVTRYSKQHRPWLYGNRSPLDHLGWISSCYIWIIHKTSQRRLSTSSDTHTSGGAIGCCKLDLLTTDIDFRMKQDGLTEPS